MASKRKANNQNIYDDIPETLNGHPFFGITPDEDQRKLIDAVWSRKKKVYLVDSIAGSGKTLISTALGVLMVKYGIYNKAVYITFPGIYEKTQGFLPGDLTKKSEPYFQPLYDALIQINEDPSKVCNTSQSAAEFGDVYIECAVSTYMRGINIENAFVIIDEAENADLHTLAKVISRIHDDCTVMVIGHSGQCDMYDKTKSGFTACIDYQLTHHPEICEAFTLRKNHRGWVSEWADLMLQEYEAPQYGFIYMTKNKINGKLYIGQHKRTMDPKDIDDTWYLGSGTLLRRAIAKYGEENFERTIIYECDSKEKLNYYEKVFIDYYNAAGDELFYNLTTGGDGLGTSMTEELKQKLRHPHKPMSDDARKHMAREISEEGRRRISEAAKANLTGFHHTDQSRANMSAGHIGSKSVYKDGVYKNVKADVLDKYISDGWVLKSPRDGFIWITKDGVGKTINKEDLDLYTSQGWVKGNPRAGKIWVKRDGSSTLIAPEKLDEYIGQGWERGRVAARENNAQEVNNSG